MEKEQQKEVEELEKVSAHIGEVKECRMCKYILLFSFAMLLIVMIVVYMQSLSPQGSTQAGTESSFHSLQPTKEDLASTTAEFNQRVLELGQTISSDTQTNSSGSMTATSSAQITMPQRRPDGPPPLLPPVVN